MFSAAYCKTPVTLPVVILAKGARLCDYLLAKKVIKTYEKDICCGFVELPHYQKNLPAYGV
jgi:hypothetical protein